MEIVGDGYGNDRCELGFGRKDWPDAGFGVFGLIVRWKQDEEVVMVFRHRMMVPVLCYMVLFGGCLNYSANRKFGDYYNTTKKIWNDQYIHKNDWFFDFEFGSLGQTIGYGGVFLALWGAVITMPVGWCVHEVEKVSLAPVADTLYLPLDFYFHDDYLKMREQKKEKVQ